MFGITRESSDQIRCLKPREGPAPPVFEICSLIYSENCNLNLFFPLRACWNALDWKGNRAYKTYGTCLTYTPWQNPKLGRSFSFVGSAARNSLDGWVSVPTVANGILSPRSDL